MVALAENRAIGIKAVAGLLHACNGVGLLQKSSCMIRLFLGDNKPTKNHNNEKPETNVGDNVRVKRVCTNPILGIFKNILVASHSKDTSIKLILSLAVLHPK